jgi:hypothetical protein
VSAEEEKKCLLLYDKKRSNETEGMCCRNAMQIDIVMGFAKEESALCESEILILKPEEKFSA